MANAKQTRKKKGVSSKLKKTSTKVIILEIRMVRNPSEQEKLEELLRRLNPNLKYK